MKKVVLVFMLLTTITFGQTKQVKDSTFNVSKIKKTEVERIVDKNGDKVEGCICSGFLKGVTIRFK